MNNPTLADVATLVGVSPATVSRAINQPAIVTVKTAARQNLRLRRSDALLVMISDAPSRFFSQILMRVEAEASKAGYNVLVSTHRKIRREYVGSTQALTKAWRTEF
jgi:DNA-binding LacI/PurR family transcriptional regulator